MNARRMFKRLLEPYHIGPVKIRNRIIKTAAETNLYNKDDHFINEKYKAYYETLARGGAGAVYVEGPGIDYPLSMVKLEGIRIDDDKYVPGLSELTQAIHKHGCPAFLQLLHAGPWHRTSVTGSQPVAASNLEEVVEFPREGFEPPRGLTVAEIEGIVDKFAGAAVRAEKAGFDGVDVNAAAAHLLSTFLSRHWNRREDAYGCQTMESRARIVTEIIRGTKKRLGEDYPVGVVINGVEHGVDDGMTIEESQELARILQTAGANSIQVRSYRIGNVLSLWPEQLFWPEPYESLPKELDWSHTGAGAFVPAAAAVKQVVSIPVITVGRLDPELGERILRQGKADFIGMCRRLMADPELPNKIAAGRMDDIAPCTACLHCFWQMRLRQPVSCRINAAFGREQEFDLRKAKSRKRVLVAGGGPAGLEAARVAALRGHDVILYARERKLGGLLPTAAMVKGKKIEDLESIVHYLKTQITKLGVRINLGEEVNLSLVEGLKPDVVILATGAIPITPEVTGINSRNVLGSGELHRKLKKYQRFFSPMTLRWLTKFWMPIGKKVVVIGGSLQGCELAEFLVKRGRKVTIVDSAGTLGEGIMGDHQMRLFTWLKIKGATMMSGVTYEEITNRGLTITTTEGERQIIDADTIICSVPAAPDADLLQKLVGRVPEVYSIGDAREPGLIAGAIADGAQLGHEI